MSNLNGYELITTEDNNSVTGGLSHANGNCIMVTRLDDGNYTIADSKLGIASPVWPLSADQFHLFGRLVARWLNLVDIADKTADLGDGAILTIRRKGKEYIFSLTGQSDLVFDAAEYRAFCWGVVFGQWPEGQPVKRLEFTA